MCITSAKLIIYSMRGVCVCVCKRGTQDVLEIFCLALFLWGESERRINQRCASLRNTSPYGDGARKTDATYSIN